MIPSPPQGGGTDNPGLILTKVATASITTIIGNPGGMFSDQSEVNWMQINEFLGGQFSNNSERDRECLAFSIVIRKLETSCVNATIKLHSKVHFCLG